MSDQTLVQGLRTRLASIEQRIEMACLKSDRSPKEVTLLAVSKTFPLDVIQAAQQLGLAHFGENKAQELERKANVIPGKQAGGTVTWHMIGHLQRNKAKVIVAHADVFHGLDSLRLAHALNRKLADANRTLSCFVQVNISGEASKAGVMPDALPELLAQATTLPYLRIKGLMTLASPTNDPEDVRPEFRRMRELRDRWNTQHSTSKQLPWLSMGMSGDFDVAIEEGATHVRVGSALFGARHYV